ncbi:hypothetical protein BAUCODRAFT_124247 [Baudoinia panamericana UAMH 10762]|uniref:BZIP domain-containing protein n=1 Tax=Baudoinia panamericana (strain UAMH 10762) TaxID=717646 RepID=M2LK64_BAUPA|nr:uncharacterized protein BAUCODRAFT_124247 [Baudoinia panamericana UAMH 10762]EMC94637.1 hypothetical protein BAUCODRAFT_124247 [Baudoinia panamericana UAMH 10762]
MAEDPGQLRRRKLSELESPRGITRTLPPLAMSSRPPPAPPPAPRHGGSPVASNERSIRRILTPRSPSLHRAASLGQLQSSTGTISAQQAPFPGSPRVRTYTIEPGVAGAPPLPTPPAGVRPNYGFPIPVTPSEAARRASSGVTRGTRNTSDSASPATSYSSYSQAEQTSPVTQYAPTAALSGPYSAAGEGSIGFTTSGERQRPLGIPISSSGGPNVYQMMTLETTSGTVQLPVDVQAASKMADEKRRRNAGASARFRQRRKEKEKEAATTISKLEQRAKELAENAEFYRRERDYLANALIQSPGGERHFPRPLSPKRRRSSSAMPGSSIPTSTGYGSATESSARSPEEERSIGSRPSTISLPPPPPQSATLGASYAPVYGYGAPIAPHSVPQVQQSSVPLGPPPTRRLSTAAPLPPLHSSVPQHPPLMQALPQTGPYNPYAPERRVHDPSRSRE